MHKQWRLKPLPPPDTVAALSDQLHASPVLATLLLQRGIDTPAKAEQLFAPDLSQLHPPLLMRGMEAAVARLARAIRQGELILLYGDYDVDGTTSIAVMWEGLAALGAKLSFYIPNRYHEGYGVSEKGIQTAADRATRLLICLDCGTRSVELLGKARQAGMEVIICDHHEPGPELPDTVALLNPKQADCPYPFKELSACGLVYKLLQALYHHLGKPLSWLERSLDLVALSTAADIVPMVDENRILMHYGLLRMNEARPRPAIAALKARSGFAANTRLSVSEVVFYLAPRINAAGRLAEADLAVRLLLSKSLPQAYQMAATLEQYNTQRKSLEQVMVEEALQLLTQNGAARATILCLPHWHKGLLGIVASRCIEHHHRPTILLTHHQGEVTGSGRSIPGFDLYQAVHACGPLLRKYGGHTQAVGLTLALEQLPLFIEQMEAEVVRQLGEVMPQAALTIDMAISLGDVTESLCQGLVRMGPYGPAHRRPVFLSEPVRIVSYEVYKGKHVKLRVQEAGSSHYWDGMAFSLADHLPPQPLRHHYQLVYALELTSGKHGMEVELSVKDLRVLGLPSQVAH